MAKKYKLTKDLEEQIKFSAELFDNTPNKIDKTIFDDINNRRKLQEKPPLGGDVKLEITDEDVKVEITRRFEK